MNAERDVLERNLELLFTRAWRPARPQPAFRGELRERFCNLAAARRAQRRSRAPLRLALAAAALLVALLGPYLSPYLSSYLGGPGRASARLQPADILAAGDVAWRAGQGAWQAAHAPADLGLRAAPLEVRTPETAGARLGLAGGSLELAADSRLELGAADELLLQRGGLEYSASADGGQSLQTVEGGLALLAGRARLELTPAGLDLQLFDARAQVSDHPAARSVEGDARLRLRGGRIIDPEPAAGGSRTRAAADVQPAAPDPLPVATPEPSVLRGVVRSRAGFDQQGQARWLPVESFRVLLLHEVQLPMAEMPRVLDVRDAQGRFSLPPCEPGSYSLFVQAAGHAVWRAAELELGAAPSDPDAVPSLDVRLDAGLSVRGVVRDALTGEPLMGAVVVSESDAPMRVLPLDAETLAQLGLARYTLSGPDGGFELEHVARGTQVLRASGAGRSVAWAETFELRGAVPQDGIVFELPTAGGLEGRVLNAQGLPNVGFTVLVSATDFTAQRPCLSYKAALVDEEGHYALDGLPGGMLAVLFFNEGDPGSGTPPDLRFVNVRPPAVARLDFIEKPTSTRLSGVLRDSSGAPLVARSLWIDSGQSADGASTMISTTTAPDGSFGFEGLRAGSHDIYMSGRLPPDLSFVGRVDVHAGTSTQVELEAGSGSISGRVRSLAGGETVTSAVVVIERAGDGHLQGKLLIDAEGRFTAEHVPPGMYDLIAVPLRGPLGPAIVRGVVVSAGVGTGGLEFALPLGGTLAVEVRARGSSALTGARVELLEPGGEVRYQEEPARTGADGQLTIEALGAGTWTVRVRLAGYREGRAQAVVRAGELTRVQVELEPER